MLQIIINERTESECNDEQTNWKLIYPTNENSGYFLFLLLVFLASIHVYTAQYLLKTVLLED